MGMHVFSYLKQTLRRKDKSRDGDWDFGARQSPPIDAYASFTRRDSNAASASSTGHRRRRSASLDDQRHASLTAGKQVDHGIPQQQQNCQHINRRVLPAGPVGSRTDVLGAKSGTPGREQGHVKTGSRVSANGPRSGSPEDDVLLAAGETAKEVRSAAGKPAETRRRAQSIAAPLLDPSGRPVQRRTTSPLTTRNGVPVPSSPTSTRTATGSPTPSIQSFRSVQTGPNDASRRAALLASKRSMPQLHNVWENFLEEAAEDADAFSFPLPPQPPAPGKYATVHATPRNSSGSQSPRQLHHTPTSSSSSASTATTTASVSTVRTQPRNATSDCLPQSPSAKRSGGHLRASHHTTSSTSSATTSTHGSTSSMTAFSSASSMTTAQDECDDGPRSSDDPVLPTPRSSAAMSPKSYKFADPSLSPPIVQRLRKSPTTPALHYQALRGVSPASSTSSESYAGSTASCSHSQSTTPTPSSACPTPSPTPYSGPTPASGTKHVSRLSPVNSRMSGQYRRAPEAELSEQPLSPGLMKGRKSSKNSRFSSLTVRSQVELKLFPSPEDEEIVEEDIVSELGYYTSGSLRRQQRQSMQSTTPSISSSISSSSTIGSPVTPPSRRSSRQHLRAFVAQSVDSLMLPRAKSVANIKHDTLGRPRLNNSHSSPPLLATNHVVATSNPVSPGAPGYLHESQTRLQSKLLSHARSQTLQHNHSQVMVDTNNITPSAHPPAASSPSSTSKQGQGQGRLRSGSASVVYNQTIPPAKVPPLRPPPAPPLDMTPTRLQPPSAVTAKGSVSSSPLTPAGAVQWGYAL